MTRQDATLLLDMAKQGVPLPCEVVTWALTVTGDAEQRNWRAGSEVDEFVHALRQGGLL